MNPIDWGLTALAVGIGWVAAPFLFIIAICIFILFIWCVLYIIAHIADRYNNIRRKIIRWWNS